MSNSKCGSDKSACCLKNSSRCNHKNYKTSKCTPKKVIVSKNITSAGSDHKSCSASIVSNKQPQTKSKKTTQSDITFTSKCPNIKTPDYCKKCGDQVERSKSLDKIDNVITAVNVRSVKNDNNVKAKKKSSKQIQQYYRNENFCRSSGSVPLRTNCSKKDSLDTIKEATEPTIYSEDSVFLVCPNNSDDDNTIPDLDNIDNLEKLKQFRKKNYFECHSVKSKIKNKPNVISIDDHKCVYRFYLNERLFPVPLNSDYNNRIRCVECHLPMDLKEDTNNDDINGTIQAKVKLGKETRDMVLLLPIKESLIIKERRTETKKKNDEYVYFGVVKLNADSNYLYNKTMPNDSLALRYQKGYKEFKQDERYAYKNIENSDVVII